MALFIKHAIGTKYNVLYSFWGYPTGLATVIVGKLFNIPSLINILGAETANLPEIKYGYLRKPLDRKLVLWTCQNASKLIAVSAYQANILKMYGIERDVQIIPWGVDENFFYPVFNNLNYPLKILHVANLNEVKDQDTLIRAFQIIRNHIPSVLKIVGPDFLKGKIQELVLSLKLQNDLEFIGFVPHKDILKYFHWADAFMLTSLSEGQNNSITEAMMCGLLPIGTPVGIMYDIGEKIGIVANCRDYKTLGEKVIDLYNRPNEWEEKRRAAYQWASSHDLRWTVQQLKNVLDDVQ
jgi:glycosyltransferase involved in cell wall biosynthesis